MERRMIGRRTADFAEKVLSALRFQISGHEEYAAAAKERCLMTAPRSGALVLFGATGDLAYKKIFPVGEWHNRN